MKMLPQAFERLAVRHKQPRHSRRQGAAQMYSAADQAQSGGPSWSQVQGMHMAAKRGICNLGVQGR